ncbi:transposase-like protein DUF772 [Nitrosomonas sp. Nm84]|nr:transposase-like protein DUF772 [Nitrosomonas sp. Nm84]
MPIDNFFHTRLDQMIDLRHPLAVLANRMPWPQIEIALTPAFERKDRQGEVAEINGLLGTTLMITGGGVSAAGRPRLPIRLMASLLYLKHVFNLSDKELVIRWSENVIWQYFSGQEYSIPKLPCNATQIGRFRTAIGESAVEKLLKATIDAAVQAKVVKPAEFESVIVDLGFHGMDADNPQVEIIHRGKSKSLTKLQQRHWLRRRQSVEPAIGHLKSDHRMDRCWLMRAMLYLRLKGILLRFVMLR